MDAESDFMLKQNAKKIHLIYGLVVSVLVITLGVALIASSLHIYRSDPTGDPYNPDSISAHFQNIAIVVYVTIGAIVGGALLNLVFPIEREKTRPIRDDWQLLKKAKLKAGLMTDSLHAQVRKERSLRKLLAVLFALCFIVLMVYPILYLSMWADFTVENATQDIMKASIIVLSPAVLGLGVLHLGAALIRKSIQRQTAIYKTAAGGTAPATSPVKASNKAVIAIRCAVAVVAIVLIVAGAFNGSAKDVLAKAVKICTECIGLG